MMEPDKIVWEKSEASGEAGDCVEWADLGDGDIGIRDSKDPAGPVLRFKRSETKAFLTGAKNGQFDKFA